MKQRLAVLDQYERLQQHYHAFVQQLQQSAIAVEIDASYAGRLIAATDNSVYQQLPQAVLYPRDEQALVALLQLANQPEFQHLHFSPRGGGTGTNGQSLTAGMVIDLSRHFTAVNELDQQAGWVRCQAGVIKDRLNDQVRSSGWFFSPDLSTSNRATLGGMINTDASGQGSLVYGKTSDHILSLRAVLVSGEVIETYPRSLVEAQRLAAGEGVEAQLYRQAIASCVQQRAQVEAIFPPLNRFLTGYDLKHCYDAEQQTIDLSRLLAGSEGTLAFITEAKLSLTRIPQHKLLVTIKYRDFQAALEHAPSLVAAQATSVETIDSTVLNLARQDIIWQQVQQQLQEVPGQALMQGINLVEFTAETEAAFEGKLERLLTELEQTMAVDPDRGVLGYSVCRDGPSIGLIYAMRKKAVGLLGNSKGRRKPIAFAEDTAVPPQHLAAFIAEFRQLLDEHNLQYGMFGHVDAGVLHVRPALDMTDHADQRLLREISDQVAALTAKYGGLMWGEHGKGYRSEYAPKFFGPLYSELQRIKAAFDPHNRLNPGKICTPIDSDSQLVSVDAVKRGDFDRQIPLALRDSFAAALNCNGNGLCFNYVAEATMCPSYRVSGERLHSPKGRAGLIREWLRLTDAAGIDVSSTPTPTKRWLQQGTHANPKDFNHQVKASMDACLACKACATQCPVKVDVPAFRSRFLAWYHQLYRRPWADYLVASIEQLAPWLARLPRVSNALTHNRISRWLLEHSIGYVDAPKLSVPSLAKRWRARGWHRYSVSQLEQFTVQQRQRLLVLVADPFTRYYHAELLEAAALVVNKLGFEAVLVDGIGNGKALHVKGFLQQFETLAKHNSSQLKRLAALNLPLMGVDAASVLLLRDEYRQVCTDANDFTVLLAHEWLLDQLPKLSQFKRSEPQAVGSLLSHCTEQSALPASASQWQQIFAALNLQLTPMASGCCGMAGTYGHERNNLARSEALYQLSWAKPVAAATDVLATGFSCRCQVARFSQQRARHPLEILAEHL